jgi:DNA-binding HxlR family transcriptional regulator
LTTLQVNGKAEGRVRAGAFSLSLLAVPLNFFVLQALEAEATSLVDLRRAIGLPPQTTMRKRLQALGRIGAIAKRRRAEFPGTIDYQLTEPGRQLMWVAQVLEGWLAVAPDGPLALGTVGAKSAVKALVDGWSTTLIRALAARPLSLTELDSLISGLSYPSLERRLASMRLAGQVVACPGEGRGTPYGLTDWLRLAAGPLAAGVRWEREYLPEETAPIGRLDVETGFLLSIPLLSLSAGRSGVCRLAVTTVSGEARRLAGVLVGIEEGHVAYCRARLEGNATAWASGSPADWLSAILEEGNVNGLEVGGDCQLAHDVVGGLNGILLTSIGSGDRRS